MPTEAKRRRNTEWARQRRERELDRLRRTAHRCPKRRGLGVCNGPLVTRFGNLGQTLIVCEWCERQRAGLCRFCSRPPYATRAIYCAAHRKEVQRRQQRASEARHHDARLAAAKAAYADPDVRRRRNEYKKLYRKAHPERVRAWKRREIEKQSRRYLEYHRRYNAMAHRARRKREQAKAAYYNQNPVRPDPHCQHCGNSIPWTPLPGGRQGAPPKNCDNCCSRTELGRRLAVRARRAAEGDDPKPDARPLVRPRGMRVRNPIPYRYAETGERLCLTPGCDVVLTHRKKKCTKCRQRETEEAQRAIAAVAGRGRRTDLERRPAA